MPPRADRLIGSLRAAACALAVAGCGGAVKVSPAPAPVRPMEGGAALVRADRAYSIDPAVAFARRLMPLPSTGVPAFLAQHPGWDGRGVLIAILDSGLDPSVPGLGRTTTGAPKVLDLRDFSGEGAVPLTRVAPEGDVVSAGGQSLAGFSRVRAVNGVGPWYAGTIRELPLGDAPAADLNWNNVVGDTLLVVVTRASDGWVLFADTDEDGSLRNERPIHDFAVARETFGWAPHGHPPGITVAANIADAPDGGPALDLVFDLSGHGTHVAGIAAGHDLYDVAGFDGVAPGAQLLGVKIADDAHGGISTTGAMLRGLDFAIRYAADRRLPLVVNLSFGVGNEREGAARIDRLFDSVLALHPEVAFTISAGNDGPGLSTVGFPGSAAGVISVGAALPRYFFRQDPGPDLLAFFTSRGGELAKPDLVTPGVAYSSVPRWHRGDEVLQGTSMASPYAAGLVALLRSAALQENVPADARRLRQALMTTAEPLPGFTSFDQGSGEPDVTRAWAWLAAKLGYPELDVRVGAASAAYRPGGLAGPGDTVQRFVIARTAPGPAPLTLTFRSDTGWLVPPGPVTLSGDSAVVTVRYRADLLRAPGFHAGVVTGWGPDTLAGPLVRLENAVVVPVADDLVSPAADPVPAGGQRRWFFGADSATPFTVEVRAGASGQVLGAFLHEPGGMPFRDVHELEGGAGSDAARFHVDARDAVAGVYEVDAVAPPASNSAASVRVVAAPFTLSARSTAEGLVATAAGRGAPAEAALSARIVGAERDVALERRGSSPPSVAFTAPAWARSIEIEFRMAPAQWTRFTDLGMTIFDSAGRQVVQSPLNYALGRLTAQLPAHDGALPLAVSLFPGLADPGDSATWTGRLAIRLFAADDSSLALTPAGDPRVQVPATGPASVTFQYPAAFWAMGEGFAPLAVVGAVGPGTGTLWTREQMLDTTLNAGKR